MFYSTKIKHIHVFQYKNKHIHVFQHKNKTDIFIFSLWR
uniref:Uncharacterized protein n=1 Tax=Anguilla anguilla TaxID=7936 RepID=A0A0E9XLX7_ANGAN